MVPDIRQKLQKLGGLAVMNSSHLLEIAQRVYNSQDSAEDRRGKKFLHAVIVALRKQTSRNRGNRLGEEERKCLETTDVPIVGRRVTGRINVQTERREKELPHHSFIRKLTRPGMN